MAACRINIRLNDEGPRSGGEPITGVVVVNADKDVACKGLIVRTIWSTHGRGNIDTGEVAQQVLFEGNWQAGQEATYAFTLPTAVWPPTYYGSYLNVGHYVTAQAKLSWAIDPKSQVEYRVVASDAPDGLKPTTAEPKQAGLVVAIVLGLIAAMFALAFIPLLLILAGVAGPIAGVVYLFKVVLPKRITGPVTCDLTTPKFRAGQNLQAKLDFTPARSSTINGIEWKIRCVEECVSGSGSNRRTHTNELFLETVTASGSRQLKSGEKQTFEFNFPIPANAAPSLKFGSNNLKWTLTARIDIPSWPDWTKVLEPVVIADPSAALKPRQDEDWDETEDDDIDPPVVGKAISVGGASTEKILGDENWLRQVIAQIQQTQHEEDALATVLAAVKDFEFPITVTLEGEMDTPEFADAAEFRRWDDAEWWSTYCPAQNIDMALAWEEGYPPEVQPGNTWQGKASIVGYEVEEKLLLMCVG